MHRRRIRFVCALVAILVSGGISPAGASDENDIRMLVGRYVEARNGRDETALRNLFTSDADQLVSNGEWRRGVEALIRGAMASSRKEAGNSSITVESVRFVTPDVAIVDGRYRTSSDQGVVRNMWTTLVTRRTDANWRISAIRNMVPAPVVSSHSR